MNEEHNTNKTEQWAIVELLGHVTVAGKISEQDFGGSKMIRLDCVTQFGEFATQFIGASAIYRIQFVDEITARAAYRHSPPVTDWDLRKELDRRGIALVEPDQSPALAPGPFDEDDGLDEWPTEVPGTVHG